MAQTTTRNRKPGRPRKSPTELIRIDAEIVRKARGIAGFRDQSVTDYLNDTLRGPVNDDARRQAAKEAAD